MSAGDWTYAGNGNFQVFVNFTAPPPPVCHQCKAIAERRTPDNRRCLAIESAPEIFALLFAAAAPDQRARLYRSLAAVFHPDVGGDERMMQVLNAVKERYP